MVTHRTNDKPEGARTGWRLRDRHYLYQGATFKLRADRVEIGGRQEMVYEYEERSSAVIVVPVTAAGEILLIRQYRYPVDEWCLETPAGGCHDAEGLSLEEVARKELREEIGAEAGALEEIGAYYTAPSFATEKCHIFIAWDTRQISAPESESTEEIVVEKLPADRAMAAARSGEVIVAPCALALLLAEPMLRMHGFLW